MCLKAISSGQRCFSYWITSTMLRPLYRSTCDSQHPSPVKNWGILLMESFSACMLLLTASNAFRLGRVNQSINNNNYFMALCPRIPGLAGTRRNIHPITPILIINILYQLLYLLRSITSSLFNLRAWQSFCTTSIQVLFGLPLGLEPSTSYFIHFVAEIGSPG